MIMTDLARTDKEKRKTHLWIKWNASKSLVMIPNVLHGAFENELLPTGERVLTLYVFLGNCQSCLLIYGRFFQYFGSRIQIWNGCIQICNEIKLKNISANSTDNILSQCMTIYGQQ